MIKRIVLVLFTLVLLTASIVYAGNIKKTNSGKATEDEAVKTIALTHDVMRGVWVTFMTLDVENESDNEAAFKKKIDSIVEEMADYHLNTMIVHVRPFCDAIYPSKLYPWSHILTGVQGKDPGYDPLAYIIEKAHAKNIAVHAWLNPYRIRTTSTPSELCSDNPYTLDTSIGVEVDGELYLNPASEKTVKLIADGVKEIVDNYPVDGIHFDDYFYPPFCGDFDAKDYEAYCKNTASPLSLEDFRRGNVNRMIKAAYNAVKETNSKTVFGISPQGNLENNAALYADVVKWCAEEGYADYICPQLYYSLDNPDLTFEDALAGWLKLKKHKGLKLYVGLPVYKAGTDADSGTWLDNQDILATELKICDDTETDGFMLYSYDSLHSKEAAKEVEKMLKYIKESLK